jgi:hypothetical protein
MQRLRKIFMSKNVKLYLLNICALMTLIPIFGVCYFYYSYVTDVQNNLRSEYLIGVVMAIVYSLPLWFGVAVAGLIMRKQIKTFNFVITQLPMCLMLGAYILLRLKS